MESMFEQIKDEAAVLISNVIQNLALATMAKDEILASMETGKVGDISSRVAFVLAKERKENPAKLAAELVAGLNKHLASNSIPKSAQFFLRIEAAGPYVNFYLSDFAYGKILSDVLLRKDLYGAGRKKPGKTVIEYPAVNPNKPWHIGHLRNAILGESVARILAFDGHSVERMDYIDDLGLQVAQSLWGFLNYDSNPSGKFDSWLGHQYVGIAKRLEGEHADKAVMDGVRETLKSMEDGDNEVAVAGRQLAEQCVRAQYETAFEFGVHHDVLVFESDILGTIFQEGIEKLKANSAVVLEKEGKNAGCWVVKLSDEFEKEFGKMENPDKILLRSDGTAVYTGKDVIFHLWKFGKLRNQFLYEPFIKQPDGKVAYKTSPHGKRMDFGSATRVINVIGVEQKYPQRVIVEVLRRLNLSGQAAALHHLSYEHVGLPDEKFSGRKGTWVGFAADDLLAEAKSRVLEKIKLDVSEGERKTIAKMVGVGAIKLSFLRTTSDKRITFKWDEALSMEGNSGPYAQYAYVRAKGILGKATENPAVMDVAFNESEKRLLMKLALFNEVVSRSSRELAPHHLAQYTLEVAADFTSFYSSSPVLVEDDRAIRSTRLAITQASAIVLQNGLNLLGIECPEKM